MAEEHPVAVVLALLQIAVGKLQEEAGPVHLQEEEHLEPCGLVAAVEALLGASALAVVAFVVAAAWQRIVVGIHLEGAVAVGVEHLQPCVLAAAVEVEELLEPCGLAVEELLQGQIFDLEEEEAVEQTVGQEEVQTVVVDLVVEVGSS